MQYTSWLCASVFNRKLIEKSISSGADIVHFDLEDSVPMEKKHEARTELKRYYQTDLSNVKTAVRINALDSTEGYRDVLFFHDNQIKPDIIIIPKCKLKADIMSIRHILGDDVCLFAVIEQAQAIKDLRDLDVRPKGLVGVIFGSADYAKDLHIHPMRADFTHVKNEIVIEAARLGLIPIDSPCFALGDELALSEQTLLAKSMGFWGKIAIHPDQISQINHDMGISDKELDAANSLINGNQPDGKSSINSVEGVMTGPPFVKYAQAVVKKHANTAPKTN